jgi:hypothetical protein
VFDPKNVACGRFGLAVSSCVAGTFFAPLVLVIWLVALHVTCARDSMPSRHRLLIYYGNETLEQAPRSELYAALLSILRSSSNSQALAIAENLMKDAREFPVAVYRDVKALVQAAGPLEFDVAVFTNALALERRYLHYRSGAEAPTVLMLPELTATSSQVLNLSPLSRADYFKAALREAASLYPADSTEAVLIVNSHGAPDMSLMPRVNVDLSEPSTRDAFRKLLVTAGSDAPVWATLKGTDKLEFWRAVSEAGMSRGIVFPLIVREGCYSGPSSWKEFFSVPGNVRMLAHTGMDGISLDQIDYQVVFHDQDAAKSWVDRLASGLRLAGMHVDTVGTLWVWLIPITVRLIPLPLFFVPLASWIAWYAFRLRLSSSNTQIRTNL